MASNPQGCLPVVSHVPFERRWSKVIRSLGKCIVLFVLHTNWALHAFFCHTIVKGIHFSTQDGIFSQYSLSLRPLALEVLEVDLLSNWPLQLHCPHPAYLLDFQVQLLFSFAYKTLTFCCRFIMKRKHKNKVSKQRVNRSVKQCKQNVEVGSSLSRNCMERLTFLRQYDSTIISFCVRIEYSGVDDAKRRPKLNTAHIATVGSRFSFLLGCH